MVNFNLLPWRVYQRHYQSRKVKIIFLLSFLVNSLLCSFIYFILAHRVQMAATHLQSVESTYIKYMTEKKSLRAPHSNDFPLMQTILHYRDQKWQWVTLLELNHPEAFCLTEIKRNHHEMLLTGKTNSVMELLQFLRYWHTLPFFSSIKLLYLNRDQTNWSFRLAAKEEEVKIKGTEKP